MSDRERESFLHGAISRAPGKRQIKPTNLAAEDFALNDDDSDEEFIHDSDAGDDESGSGDSSEQSDEDEDDEEKSLTHSSDNEASIGGLEGTSSGKPEPLICSVCLNTRNVENDRVIQCDKCGIAVHEGCYAVIDSTDDQASVISNFSTEPWFCEPCLFNVEKPPHCELCPQQFGAFKRADVGGKWIHLSCAMFTPGISFGDIESLSAISWQEIDYKRFGRKPCNGCTNVLEARTGITTSCEAGLCKHHYHISCAQRLGLLIDAESENLPELSSKHVDPHFILCRTHNITELVAKKRQNYAIFMCQEQKRMMVLNRRLLDQREIFKLSRQRKQYDDRIKNYQNVTIHLPAIHNKRTRLVQTSPTFLEAFTEKAELFGISSQDFTDGFTRLPPSQISYIAPSFSTEFVQYFSNRENNVFAEEEQRLREGKCELKKVMQAEQDLKLLLAKSSAKQSESLQSSKQKSALEQKFTDLCEKLGMVIEEEEEGRKREASTYVIESPKPKRQKLEEPTVKRQRSQPYSQKDAPQKLASKSQAHSTPNNFRQLKNDNWRQRHLDRASSLISGSVDSNLESEDDDSPPSLNNIDEVNSVATDDEDEERPVLVPMISSDVDDNIKKRLLSKNPKSTKRGLKY